MLRLYLYARVRFFAQFCTRDRGCSKHPAFPAPSSLRAKRFAKPGRNAPRECGGISGHRHCERSEAIHLAPQRKNGLLRGACHRAALCADPVARNDVESQYQPLPSSPRGKNRKAAAYWIPRLRGV
jgi:hypothetical protein